MFIIRPILPISFHQTDAAPKRPVNLFHLGGVQCSNALSEPGLINSAKLLQEDNGTTAQSIRLPIQTNMCRQPRFSHLAGDGGCDHCGAVAVAYIVLQNEYRTDTTLLRPDDWPQVSIVNVTTADFLSAICFHRIHLLSILGLISQK